MPSVTSWVAAASRRWPPPWTPGASTRLRSSRCPTPPRGIHPGCSVIPGSSGGCCPCCASGSMRSLPAVICRHTTQRSELCIGTHASFLRIAARSGVIRGRIFIVTIGYVSADREIDRRGKCDADHDGHRDVPEAVQRRRTVHCERTGSFGLFHGDLLLECLH